MPGESDETTEKDKFQYELLRLRSGQQRSQGYSKILQTSQRDHSTELFYINFLENRTRPRKKVFFLMDCYALNRDNSAFKATANFSVLHNETTSQSFFILIAWRTGQDHRERKIAIRVASLKIETTAQSRLQQILQTSQRHHSTELFYINCLEIRTRPQKKVNF